jgi:hypothetical protein
MVEHRIELPEADHPDGGDEEEEAELVAGKNDEERDAPEYERTPQT